MNDIIIFFRGTKNIRNLMSFFNRYAEASGQVINRAKFPFYSGSISQHRNSELSNILGFKHEDLPFIYLRIPLFQGKPRNENSSSTYCEHHQEQALSLEREIAFFHGKNFARQIGYSQHAHIHLPCLSLA